MSSVRLFFELIQVAIGQRKSLSRVPSEHEWSEIYAIAKAQTLVGVCFAGVQRLYNSNTSTSLAQADDVYSATKESVGSPKNALNPSNLSKRQYMMWMGMATKIQQRNEVVLKQCIAVQDRFAALGYKSAVLKGQDYARYYVQDGLNGIFSIASNFSNCGSVVSNFCILRQSGDIDLWVDGDRDKVIAWARKEGVEIGHIDIKHSDMNFFRDTEVEVHFQPSWMYYPKTNRRLMEWFDGFKNFEKYNGMIVPSLEFSLVYCMVHIYRHFFSEGIGLRQVLDMYFLLLHSSQGQRVQAMCLFDKLHMRKAVSGIMYLLEKCFGMDGSMLFCATDEKLGVFLLGEMMYGGNFGHEDNRYKHLDKSHRWQRGFIGLKRNLKYLRYFPEEVLWSPFWKIWHYCWRKRKGYL